MEFAEFIKTPKVDGVTLRRPFCSPLEGTLCVTGHHLILSSRKEDNEIWLLHSRVDSVEKRLNATGNVLTLKCKDFVLLQLDIRSAEDCINVASSIEQLSNIGVLSIPDNSPQISLRDGFVPLKFPRRPRCQQLS